MAGHESVREAADRSGLRAIGPVLATILALAATLVALVPMNRPAVAQVAGAAADSFPHLAHQGLFPLCVGCHTGIPDGNLATAYPDPISCDGCHNGIEQPTVDWEPEPLPAGLVDFSHPTHTAAVAADPGSEPELDCAACHVEPGGARLAVAPLNAGSCLSCHDQDPDDHYAASTDCASCHRPLAGSETGERLMVEMSGAPAALVPADHGSDDFVATHAPTATEADVRCSTCHIQERCASCHVAIDRPALDAVPIAPRGWELPSMPATYPTPSTHLDDGFDLTHGVPAPTTADCSTCHTRNDCLSCHIQPAPAVIDSLVTWPDTLDQPPRVQAPGVGLVLPSPNSHQSPFFMTAHPLLSSGQPDTCATCHEQSFCTTCHEQPGETGFHPGGFVLRHAPAASSAFQDCSSCHSTERFCRECHVQMGTGSTGRLGPGFHDAEPLFLLRHGTAARRDLESCASCHTQNDCRQCHSQTGAFGVSPHGPDFDAASAQAANPFICSACHIGAIGEPIGGGGVP